jgi:hypothetical protein
MATQQLIEGAVCRIVHDQVDNVFDQIASVVDGDHLNIVAQP